MDKILPRRASSLAVGIMLFLLEDKDDVEEEEEGEGPLPPGIEVKVRGHSRYWRSRSVLVASLQRRKKKKTVGGLAQFLFIYFFSTRESPIE